MEIRVILTKYLTSTLATLTFLSASTTITKNTIWSNDITLTKSVIVNKNIILTIKKGVNIFIDQSDLSIEDHGHIGLSILGAIKIEGTVDSMVTIRPSMITSNKNYWTGITIHESKTPSKIEFLSLSNARNGIDIKSKTTARGLIIENCGKNGIYIESATNDSIELNNIEIKRSDGLGLFIQKGNVFIDWVSIHDCKSIGLVNNNYGVVDIHNTRIINNKDNGIVNYGNMTVYNLLVKENRHGIIISSGFSVITNGSISKNRSNGLLIGGSSNVNIEGVTIDQNKGYGLELTDWSQEDYSSLWLKEKSPSVGIIHSNFIDNYKTNVLDQYRYNNIWSDWNDIEYSGDGWVQNWQENIHREIPFGRIGWVGFQYNSNNGGSEFSWQPCTGNSVWSPIFEIQNSRDQTITYLPAPFQCSWNPLAGKNSNTWINYGDFVGTIDSSDSYSDWIINKTDLASSNKYLLKQYFKYAFLPGQDSSFAVKPDVTDFSLSFYHGGNEVSSYSDNSNINLNSNYWGSLKKKNQLANLFGNTDLKIDTMLASFNKDGSSNLESDKNIIIYTPSKGLAYQEIKLLEISWQTFGWMPMVDIFISVDNGDTWESIGSDIINNGKYSWWNNLIVGEKFFIKVEDSYNSNNRKIVGPCDVIENITPSMQIEINELHFITGENEKEFSIKNIGGGLLEWSLSSNVNWINLNRYSGSAKRESFCTVKVNRTGVSNGKYNGKIFINSKSDEKHIDVSMIVAKPSLYIDTKYLSFDSTKNSQTFNMKNFGGGTMTWEILSDVHWLIVKPNKGKFLTAKTVGISIDRSKLRIGNNNATLKISSNVGERTIDVSAFGTEIPKHDTVKSIFDPWHWMYNYDVY